MLVYAVIINEYDDHRNMYVSMVVGLYFTKDKALAVIDTIPEEANPHWAAYIVE